jgi:hypothetical protein
MMRNRLIMGAIRYGRLNAPGKPQYDRVKAIIDRAHEFAKTQNLDLLPDIANLALLEFEEGNDPRRHIACRDGGQHVQRK